MAFDTGVVHQDVDRAELLDGLFSHRGDFTFLADVSLDGDGLAAHGFDLLDNPFGVLRLFFCH